MVARFKVSFRVPTDMDKIRVCTGKVAGLCFSCAATNLQTWVLDNFGKDCVILDMDIVAPDGKYDSAFVTLSTMEEEPVVD